MAFYTANYIKKLIKEDSKTVIDTIKKKDGDFRKYIDNTLPFSLYMDIADIEKSVVTNDSKFIQGAQNIKGVPIELLKQEIISAYKKVINYYIDSYEHIRSQDLNNILQEFSLAVQSDSGNIKSTIQSTFKKTLVSSDVSKRDQRLLIISPKFSTVQSAFGKKFKEFFDYSKFSDKMDLDTGETPRNQLKSYLSTGFANLQNLGHSEIDIISSTSSEVKRGIVTPALLAALVDIPNSIKPEKIARRFSKETGQAETRIVVRKKYAGSRLVLEMLIEAGIMIGTVESTKSNANKAPKERAFQLGKGISDKILKDPKFLANLVTSKSINDYIAEYISGKISGKSVSNYSSSTEIKESAKFTITKVESSLVKNPQNLKKVNLPKLKNLQGRFTSVASIQSILNAKLHDQIQKNMGKGRARKILNYRTGRFANSAYVTSVVNREQYLEIFYTYMKYPYQTFEPGFKQGYPESRDPKLLISKSIREIASTLVKNKLRTTRV